MAIIFFVIFLAGMGVLLQGEKLLVKNIPQKVDTTREKELIQSLKDLYANNFTKDDEVIGAYADKTLQDYCKDHNLICRDKRGDWKWEIRKELSPSGLFDYYVITIYDSAGRKLGEVSGLPYWAKYLEQVEKNQAVICKGLIDYYRDMVRVYSYPLNWYAKNGALCHYDNGVDSLDFGGFQISKEIPCSEGWKTPDLDDVLRRIVGGIWKWPTGDLQYDNANEIYSYGFPCYGATTADGQVLTGNNPPYAVAFRLWIKTDYYTACCGY